MDCKHAVCQGPQKCPYSRFISVSSILRDLHSLSRLHTDITCAVPQKSEQKRLIDFSVTVHTVGSQLHITDLFLNRMYQKFGIYCQGKRFVDQIHTL